MTGIEERVKGFLESWRKNKIELTIGPVEEIKCDEKGPMIWIDSKRIQDLGIFAHCQVCGAELVDGGFAMIDRKFYCLKCHEVELNKLNKPNEHNGHVK